MNTIRKLHEKEEPQRCWCGHAGDHVIARRETADGVMVAIWSCGDVTRGVVGAFQIPGLGFAHGLRSRWARRCREKAVRLIADEIGAYDLDELPTLIAAASATYRHAYDNEDARRRDALSRANRRLRRRALEEAQ